MADRPTYEELEQQIQLIEETKKDLRRSKALLNATQKITKVGGWEWDVESQTMFWTSELYRIHDFHQDLFTPGSMEHIDKGIECYEPEDRKIILEAFKNCIESGEAYDLEFLFHTRKRQRKWIRTIAEAIRENGTVIKVIGNIIDITAHKQAEEELRESEEMFRALFEQAGGYCMILDPNTLDGIPLILDANKAACAAHGYTREEFIGRPVTIIDDEDGKRLVKKSTAEIMTGEPFSIENTHVRRDGTTFPVEVNAKRIDVGDRRPLILTTEYDITERKQTENQLQHSQKMESIGTLAGGIAHDFNNILAAIIGYAEMIQDDCPVGSTSAYYIDQVLKASNRAKGLVKQILAFSRQVETHTTPIQPATIVKEALELLRASLPTTITIEQNIDPGAGVILADPTQFHQIIVNLCTNAFHAMEMEGGTLTISLQKRVLTEEDLSTELDSQPGNFLLLSIKDTGVGIAPDILGKIFDPFFTTKEVGKGTGMGLSMVHGLVKTFGGSITCNSRLGEGTVFHVMLPAVENHATKKSEFEELTPHSKEHILLVDDEEILIELGQTMLERLGYQVTARKSSLEALNIFQDQPNTFDLVITDQTMPGITGMDMARRMLQLRPGMPIILSTGYSSLVSEEKAKAIGIKGFAMKPLAKKDIGELIRKVLDGEK